jgi:hypothetical protein
MNIHKPETFAEIIQRQRRNKQLKEAALTILVLAVGFGFIAILARIWP